MPRKIIEHNEALDDIIKIAYYLSGKSSLNTSDRFLDAAKKTYRQLAEMPGLGVLRDYDNPKNAGMRMFPVTGFPKYLIFYRATEDMVEILRIIHGARDLQVIFGPDEEATE